MNHRRRIVIGAALAVLFMLVALPVSAHVTVRSDNNQTEGFAVYTVRVPNESDTGSTVRVEVQMPEGLEASRYEAKPGWDISITDGVLVIDGGPIAPGQFAEFRFQARNPAAAGEISFAAIQTYDDGEIVNWTGDPDSDTPASVVEIIAASSEVDDHGVATGDDEAAAETIDDEGTDIVSIIALILGALGVLLGGAALATRKK